MQIRLRYFDVVTEYLVEAHLERANTRAFALTRLNAGDAVLTAVAECSQSIELSIDAMRDRRFLADRERRMIDNVGSDRCGIDGAVVPFVENAIEKRRVPGICKLPNELLDAG